MVYIGIQRRVARVSPRILMWINDQLKFDHIFCILLVERINLVIKFSFFL